MPTIPLRIPAIGEGLQEAMLVNKLKKSGDAIKRDEPIYEMETDKAVMTIESPITGTLEEWLVEEGTVVAVGTEIAKVNTEDVIASEPAPEQTPAPTEAAVVMTAAPSEGQTLPASNLTIPPRTRAYAKEKGLTEEQLTKVPAKGGKLMPEDIDAHLGAAPQPSSNGRFTDTPLSTRQKMLAVRLVKGAQTVVPGTIERPVNWGKVEEAREAFRAGGGDFQPSQFTIFAFLVAQATRNHPKFRSSMPDETRIRTYDHVNLGTAVALPDDELVTAVVLDADTLGFRGFCDRMRDSIELARTGKDQATESTQLALTNMASFGLRSAVPVLVSPAVAVLFMGETYDLPVPVGRGFSFQRTVNLVLTFDHRVINGVGAAQFLTDICTAVENALEALGDALPAPVSVKA